MNINRHNYEEFFLMYVDNELSAGDRRAVEEFVAQNPDLGEELVMLRQSTLTPDPTITFDHKNKLLKNITPSNLVNETNYEEYFVLYNDNELNNEEKNRVEQFVYRHPQYQEEFELIQKIKLVPDNTVVFTDKHILYRRENEPKVVPFHWWKIAIAASVLLFIGVAGWYYSSMSNHNAINVVAVKPDSNKAGNITPENEKTTQVADADIPSRQTNSSSSINKEKIVRQDSKAVYKPTRFTKKVAERSNINERTNVPHEKNQMAINSENQTKLDPSGANTGTVRTTQQKPIIDIAVGENELNGAGNHSTSLTYTQPDPETDNNIVYVANTSLNKKNKLRGIFRKASRIFEKATNIESSENNRGIRIANIEIALK